ncbi:serine/threonine protein kinase [Mucilaginibacter sp. SG538B]|uniref:lanthionine synthetase LanC family protein n=1 Tax=Mucilaginibacter sp. SG538B TaxID=2587021 RepID=UPI00159DA775|nr:lanthionine synthetase LanC family protein [Mucilaginibacter sp. SG538B]NVM62206.1 serine/threonine protein kinase [Mucilaginibacter sp. SG538B]
MEQIHISQHHSVFSKPVSKTTVLELNPPDDYSFYLAQQRIAYSVAEPYLTSGTPDESNNWLIHVSVVPQHFDQLIRPLLAFLKPLGVYFAIPVDIEKHNSILDGTAGFALTCKVIAIITNAPEKAKFIVKQLCELTIGIIGPAMPCAYHLTPVIAVSYGRPIEQNCQNIAKEAIFYGSVTADKIKQNIRSNKLQWPFGDIRTLKPLKQPRLLNRQYIPIETFKKAPKGNVFKALKINRVFDMQSCVIKQGRQYQSFDNAGRDAKDRLRRQVEIHRHFETKGILPKAIAYFELQGDAFFAMEYKESVSLTEKAAQLSEGRTWRTMPSGRKREIICYLLQVVDILCIFHQEGFVHRDVTPANFIVTETGRVFAIDVELCYHIGTGTPNPPFTLGTPGHMSPAQESGEAPFFQDDIYSLGALLISVLTGILPNKLNQRNLDRLTRNLSYFIDSPSVVTMTVACLNADVSLRSSLREIKNKLELYDTVLLTTSELSFDPIPDSFDPATVIKDGIQTLAHFAFKNQTRIAGDLLSANHIPLSELIDTDWHRLQHNGIAAVGLLTLFTRFCPPAERAAMISAINNWLENTPSIQLSSLDLQIFAAELSLAEIDTQLLSAFMNKAKRLPDDFIGGTPAGLSGGLAGRGLKLLYLADQQSAEPDLRQLLEIVKTISTLQQQDGSWTTDPSKFHKKSYAITGFSHGVTGITYFLLSYYAKFPSHDLKMRITSALNWLSGHRKPDRGRLTWPVSTENNTVDPWLEHGFTGVALTFIKAFEVLGDIHYQQIAAEVLGYHPVQLTSNYCAFGNGLSGLGEVYLEAFRVFADDEWYVRAAAVRDVLLNSCYRG